MRRFSLFTLNLTIQQEIIMPVPQDIQDVLATLPDRVKAHTDAAVAAATAALQAQLDDANAKLAAATSAVVQDETDTVAALKSAIDAAAPAA